MSELPDAPLHPQPTDDEAWAYERLVERVLRETMIGSQINGQWDAPSDLASCINAIRPRGA